MHEGGIAGVEIDASNNTTSAAFQNKLARLEVSDDQVIADSTMPLWVTATALIALASAAEDNRHLVDLLLTLAELTVFRFIPNINVLSYTDVNAA